MFINGLSLDLALLGFFVGLFVCVLRMRLRPRLIITCIAFFLGPLLIAFSNPIEMQELKFYNKVLVAWTYMVLGYLAAYVLYYLIYVSLFNCFGST